MTSPNTAPAVPVALAPYAWFAINDCAAAAGMSTSQWRAWVAAGRAPAPVVSGRRFTRWRAADVVAFLEGGWRPGPRTRDTVGHGAPDSNKAEARDVQ